MSESRNPRHLTPSQEVKIGTPPLMVATASAIGVYINNHIHNFRGGPLGNLNPADYIGNVWGSAFIGICAFTGAAVLERAHPKLENCVASVALAATCGFVGGAAVNASWETKWGVDQITSHIPEDTPLIGDLNGTHHTADTIDLAVGTFTSGLTAAMMAIQRQYYIRREDEPGV